MHRLIVTVLLALLTIPAFAADVPKTEEQKTLYAIGVAVSRSLAVFSLSPGDLEYVRQGLADAVSGKKTDIDPDSYSDKIQELALSRRTAQGEKMAVAGKAFLEKSAQEKGAVKTSSGLVYISRRDGTGVHPKPADFVRVNYRGALPDGKEFDSSYQRGEPSEFRLNEVIACWTEGVQMMKVGGSAMLICPATIAYGDSGAGDLILPGATLVFEVELLGVLAEDEK